MSPTRPTRARQTIARGVTALLAAAVVLAATPAAAAPAPAPPAPPAAPGPSTPAPPTTQVPQSYLVADADTGAIVAQSNEHVPHLTASTIKVMTAITTLQRLPLTAKVQVSALAAAQPAMKISMTDGSVWPVDQALASLLMVSANDAAYALAENVGGSLDGFAVLANKDARALGMRDTTFRDPAGLDGSEGFGGGSLSSAYDLAIVSRNALAAPPIADYAGKVTYEFTDPNGVGRRLTNHNKGFLTGYPGAIGLKTGFTKAASRTLLAAARRDGHTCIASVMGTWDDTGWASWLLDQCFAGVRLAGVKPLPPVRIKLAGATSTATGRLVAATAPSTTTPPSTTPPTSAPAVTKATATPRETSTTAAASADDGTTLGDVLRTAGIVLLVLLAALVILRRRAVKRQKARRIERMRAHAEARRRRMIDVIEPDETGSDIRVVPGQTAHHVSAGRRHQVDRRVVRPARPRDHSPSGDRGRR